jgi:hypothetical protein
MKTTFFSCTLILAALGVLSPMASHAQNSMGFSMWTGMDIQTRTQIPFPTVQELFPEETLLQQLQPSSYSYNSGGNASLMLGSSLYFPLKKETNVPGMLPLMRVGLGFINSVNATAGYYNDGSIGNGTTTDTLTGYYTVFDTTGYSNWSVEMQTGTFILDAAFVAKVVNGSRGSVYFGLGFTGGYSDRLQVRIDGSSNYTVSSTTYDSNNNYISSTYNDYYYYNYPRQFNGSNLAMMGVYMPFGLDINLRRNPEGGYASDRIFFEFRPGVYNYWYGGTHRTTASNIQLLMGYAASF